MNTNIDFDASCNDNFLRNIDNVTAALWKRCMHIPATKFNTKRTKG